MQRRHGLEPFLDEAPAAPDAGLSVRIRFEVGHLNLRGRGDAGDFAASVESALGQPLPLDPNTMSRDRHEVCWLGPDEWLIITALDALPDCTARLRDKLGNHVSSLVDVTGGQILLELSGPDVRQVLAKGCTLDLHSAAFGVGDCAQCGLADANVLLALVDPAPIFHVIVRRSFSDYLLRWLTHAAGEKGAKFSGA